MKMGRDCGVYVDVVGCSKWSWSYDSVVVYGGG
jgi:hypothetical protein